MSAFANKDLLTASDMATLCSCDLKTIHNWADRGKIAHFRTPGRHIRIRRLDAAAFLKAWGYPIPAELEDAPTASSTVAERSNERVPPSPSLEEARRTVRELEGLLAAERATSAGHRERAKAAEEASDAARAALLCAHPSLAVDPLTAVDVYEHVAGESLLFEGIDWGLPLDAQEDAVGEAFVRIANRLTSKVVSISKPEVR